MTQPALAESHSYAVLCGRCGRLRALAVDCEEFAKEIGQMARRAARDGDRLERGKSRELCALDWCDGDRPQLSLDLE